MFRIPYRWTWRNSWKNIYWAVDDAWCGIKNVVRWTPVIWFDADFDHDYLSEILEYKFRRMSKKIGGGPTLSRGRKARELAICALLCKRMREDVYYANAKKRYPERGTAWAKMIESLAKQDQQMLGRMIAKHYRSWWD